MKLSTDAKPNRWDFLVAAAVLALAILCGGLFWLQGRQATGALTAVVCADGGEIDRFALSDASGELTYSNNGYTLHVLIQDSSLRITAADCPNQDCVHTGEISRPGQSILCLPARISIQLTGGSGDGVDAVLR